MITERDDLRHIASAEENFSESKWFSFYDGTHDFWVSSRIGLEANRRTANRWIVVALGGKVIHHDLRTGLELPSNDWDHIAVGGLCYQTVDPLKRYRILFSAEDLSLEFAWEARTPVFDYMECLAPLPPSLAAAHYEQSGVVRGTVSYAGRIAEIVGTGHRDHSWGVRHWEGFHSWAAFMGRLDLETYFHLEEFNEQTSGRTRHGFLSRGGENIHLKEARIESESLAGSQFPDTFRIWMEDAGGESYSIRGKVRLLCPLTFGKCTVGESFGTFTWNGVSSPGIIECGFTQ